MTDKSNKKKDQEDSKVKKRTKEVRRKGKAKRRIESTRDVIIAENDRRKKKQNCHTTNHKQPIWSDRKIDKKANSQGFRTAVTVVVKVPSGSEKKLLLKILYCS